MNSSFHHPLAILRTGSCMPFDFSIFNDSKRNIWNDFSEKHCVVAIWTSASNKSVCILAFMVQSPSHEPVVSSQYPFWEQLCSTIMNKTNLGQRGINGSRALYHLPVFEFLKGLFSLMGKVVSVQYLSHTVLATLLNRNSINRELSQTILPHLPN